MVAMALKSSSFLLTGLVVCLIQHLFHRAKVDSLSRLLALSLR